MNARRLLCGFVIALSCCLSLAQDAATQPASRPAMTREEGIKYLHGHRDEVKKYMSANQEIGKLFAAKEYEKAAEACVAFTKDYPWDAGGFYNLACAQARMGKADEAVASLKSALAVGYDDTAHLKTDADLASLHKHDSWKDLVEQSRKNEVTGPWEKGAEFKGVKTVEDFPEGGLRYRLRMSPDATKDKPNKLVIWMHPSGGSANIYVENEPMLKMLLDNNLALLVFTKKSWAGWSDEDAAKMLNVTLPAVGKIEGIDVRRPILMGFSAGGQLSLSLYQDNVGKFGGLVLDAAYPGIQTISPDNPRQIKTLPMKLKKSDALKGTPILAYVGKLDGGAAIWKQAEPKWLELGVPLTVVYVPEARHQWMLDAKHPAEREILADWLAKVAKGQTPTSQPASQPTTAPVPVATPQREE